MAGWGYARGAAKHLQGGKGVGERWGKVGERWEWILIQDPSNALGMGCGHAACGGQGICKVPGGGCGKVGKGGERLGKTGKSIFDTLF